MDQALAIGLDDVLAARERVRGDVYYSPCARSEMLSKLTGHNVYLKLENLQMTGSFKERGALNRLSLLTAEEAARGVVAASDATGEGDGDTGVWRGGGVARGQL
jgi:threonine dehydratase